MMANAIKQPKKKPADFWIATAAKRQFSAREHLRAIGGRGALVDLTHPLSSGGHHLYTRVSNDTFLHSETEEVGNFGFETNEDLDVRYHTLRIYFETVADNKPPQPKPFLETDIYYVGDKLHHHLFYRLREIFFLRPKAHIRGQELPIDYTYSESQSAFTRAVCDTLNAIKMRNPRKLPEIMGKLDSVQRRL